jgi:ABC-type transport system involved in multi-copper enzyme maturation permease subunit
VCYWIAQKFVSLKSAKILGGIWPVVQRELREGARRPFNYWLRVGAATAGLLTVIYVVIENRDETDKVMGQYLFAGLHVALMGLICLVVPLMTADCIAREKREGTLGLLFLTPLTAGGIVAGKGLAQALRALTMWVSVAPVLAIPFVMGGIEWADASAFLALEFSALVLCLAAGLLASTLVRGRGAAFVLALFLGVLFVAVFCRVALMCFFLQIHPTGGFLGMFFPFGYHMFMLLMLSGLPTDVASVGGVGVRLWHQILWVSPIAAFLLFVLVLRFAAWRLAGSWQDKIPSLRQESLVRRYCTPVFKGWFTRRTGRILDRNPIAWLQQYSWKTRLIKWVLCLAFVVVETADLMVGPTQESQYGIIEPLFILTVAAGMTFAGINSFAEEKRSGALELILVTPIPINQIIFGRIRGVWEQFLPAAIILASFDAGLYWISSSRSYFWGFQNCFHYLISLLPSVCVFFTLPVFALYFALRVKNQIAAAGMTWFLVLLPYLFITFLVWALVQIGFLPYFDIPEFLGTTGCPLANLALAVAAFFLLRHRLTRRLYSFS